MPQSFKQSAASYQAEQPIREHTRSLRLMTSPNAGIMPMLCRKLRLPVNVMYQDTQRRREMTDKGREIETGMLGTKGDAV